MEIIGSSQAMKRVKEEVRKLSKGRKNVFVIGEDGVGKGLVAEMIHLGGRDARKPYVRLNVAGIDPGKMKKLVESTIESGEFINPVAPDHGNFKIVDGTTIILEDLDRSGLAVQRSVCDLLAFAGKSRRGLRMMILLSVPIAQSVRDGQILSCVAEETKYWELVKVPPLRERAEDIPELVEFFVKEIGNDLGMSGMVIDANAIGVLVRQEWKENVRELKRLVERSMVLTRDRRVFKLPAGLVNEQAELTRVLDRIEEGTDFALDNSMEIIEKGILLRTLEKFEFNQSRTARFLKMTEDTLRYRMKKLGIPTARKQ
jgi:DNA-binding NtrC family response regulator